MNRTVYIIDDEPSICVSLQLALKNLYRVKTFTSSLPALASMEAEGADIVLLDLRLGEGFCIAAAKGQEPQPGVMWCSLRSCREEMRGRVVLR